jgi:hypothetical protein
MSNYIMEKRCGGCKLKSRGKEKRMKNAVMTWGRWFGKNGR